jgi:hypothetical protein
VKIKKPLDFPFFKKRVFSTTFSNNLFYLTISKK